MLGSTLVGSARLLGRPPWQLVAIIAAVITLSVALATAMLAQPLYTLHLIEGVTESRSMPTLLWLTLLFCLAMATAMVVRALRLALLRALLATVERKLYLLTLKASIRLAREGRPERASFLLTDFGTLRRFLASGSIADMTDLLTIAIPLAFMFAMHPWFGWTLVVGCTLVAAFSFLTERRGRRAEAESSTLSMRADAELSRHMMRRDEVLGLGLLAGIVRHWYPMKRDALLQRQAAALRAEALSGICHVVALLTLCAVFVVSAVVVVRGQATPASFIVSHILAYSMILPFERVAQNWLAWSKGLVAFERLRETLASIPPAEEARISDAGDGLHIASLRLEVPGSGRVLLDDLNLHSTPGTVVVLTGRNGTGKSTLLRALVGLVPPAEGAVVFDGLVLYRAERSQIGPRLGYLAQRPQLLNASVAENISRFADDSEGAIRAARLAGAHEMIGRLQDGYATLAGSGTGLSGGQQRQVALARALYGNPGLVVLDEPEVGLDAPALAALVAAVGQLRQRGAIVFLVTHDLPRWDGIADLELRLEGEGRWTTHAAAQSALLAQTG